MGERSLYEKPGKLLFLVLWIPLKITISSKDFVCQLALMIKNCEDTHSPSNLILGI